MSSLFSRFTFNSQVSRFHSSGIAANQKGIGTAASGKTFATRKHADMNRQRVNQYDAAALNHDYRKEALPEMQQIQQKNQSKYKQRADELRNETMSNRENYLRKQQINREHQKKCPEQNGQQGQDKQNIPVVPMDGVNPRKQEFNAGPQQQRQIAVPARDRVQFREPPSRGYNPYR